MRAPRSGSICRHRSRRTDERTSGPPPRFNARRLAKRGGSGLHCAPSGARLAYECGQDICAINADSTGLAQLSVDAVGNHHPTWAPDGSKIAFAATHAGVTDLYVMAANGSGAVQLTQSVGFVGSPAWSPDGTTIAFDPE